MMPIHSILVTAFVLTVFSLNPAYAFTSRDIHGRVVKIHDFPMAESGVMRTWVEFSVIEDGRSSKTRLLLIYLSDKQDMPRMEETCRFRVHNEMVGEIVGRNFVKPSDSIVIEDFHCDARD